MRLQSSARTTSAATRPAPSTISEVSMRSPCQTMTTSPGRSASQATPSDNAPTTMRKRTTRDHCEAGLLEPASAAAAICRLAAIAASRAFAFSTQPAASGFAASGNAAMSVSAAAMSARAASASIRAMTADGSLPAGASTGVMRTRCCALASSRPRKPVGPDDVFGSAPQVRRERCELVRERGGAAGRRLRQTVRAAQWRSARRPAIAPP